MKNYYADDYCPQREKVLDISRSTMSGGRKYARYRRRDGRYIAKVERQASREQLARAAKWQCICEGDPEIDCGRCYSDDLPTVSDTRGSAGLPKGRIMCNFDRYTGFADDLGLLFRWYQHRTAHLDHFGAEAFLRQMLLASPFGHSLKTRHAFDHLFEQIQHIRLNACPRWSTGRCIHRVPETSVDLPPN